MYTYLNRLYTIIDINDIYNLYKHKSCIPVYIWWPRERGGSLPQRRVVGAIPSVAYRSTCHWNHEHSFMRKNVNQPLFVIPLKRILASCGQRTGSARVNQPFDFKRSRSTSLRKLGLIIISCMHIRLFTTVCIRMSLHFSTQPVTSDAADRNANWVSISIWNEPHGNWSIMCVWNGSVTLSYCLLWMDNRR